MTPNCNSSFDHYNRDGKSNVSRGKDQEEGQRQVVSKVAVRAMMEGGKHIMDDEEDNDVEWAVGDGGSGATVRLAFWANVHQHNHLLSQCPSAGETEEQQQGQWRLQ